jgi:hypothetical protein
LAWSAPDGLADGNTLTITTDGTYSFGTKAQAAPILWAFGSEIYENGVLNTSESALNTGDAVPEGAVWALANNVTISNDTRHANVNQMYRGGGEDNAVGIVGWPNCMLSVAGDRDSALYSEKLFCSFRSKYSADVFHYRAISYDSLTGSFDDGSTSFDIGEEVTGTGGLIGHLQYVDTVNSIVHIRTAKTTAGWDSASTANATLTGSSTGATLRLRPDITYIFPLATKFFRAYEAISQPQYLSSAFSQSGNVLNGKQVYTEQYRITPTPLLRGGDALLDWHTIEFYADNSGALGTGYLAVAGESVTWDDYPLTLKSPTGGMVPANMGFDLPTITTAVFVEQFFGEIYVDNTSQRVVIGTHQDFATNTSDDFEFLRPTAWGGNSITCSYKHGTGFLFVIDGNGDAVNTTGVPINA